MHSFLTDKMVFIQIDFIKNDFNKNNYITYLQLFKSFEKSEGLFGGVSGGCI